MGSAEAMETRGGLRYFAEDAKVQVTQGVSGSVQDKGSMRQYLPYLEQSLKHAMQDLGASLDTHLGSNHSIDYKCSADRGTVRGPAPRKSVHRAYALRASFSFRSG